MGSIGLGRLELAAIRRLCHHENDSGTSFRPAVILREDHAGILWVKRPWEVTKSCPPISIGQRKDHARIFDSLRGNQRHVDVLGGQRRSEEHTSELQSLMRNSYAGFCLKKQNIPNYRH